MQVAQIELMYQHSSIVIVVVLFLIMVGAYEVAFRWGRRYQRRTHEEIKLQTNAIQAGVLGLLALLLGFTFNMALQRFDLRSEAVIHEANAIGTAQLRSRLLPEPFADQAHNLLKEYVDLRIEVSQIDLTHVDERRAIQQKTEALSSRIWNLAIAAADVDPRPVTTGYFITSLNDAFDARSARNSTLSRHVPEVILYLLFIVFIATGAMMGYAAGLSLRRAYVPALVMTLLIVLVVFIIIDLDRPKRGVIMVSQAPLEELR